MKTISSAGLLALGFSLSACATIVDGTTQSVSITTSPDQGANCALSNTQGTWYVTSPGSVTVHKTKTDLNIHCTKAGFQDSNMTAPSKFGGATFGNIVAGGLIGAGVDAASGANYYYDTPIIVSLAPIQGAAGATNNYPAIPGGRIAMDSERAPAPLASPIRPASLSPQKPSLGVTGGTVNPFDAMPAKKAERYGAWVNAVLPDGAAAKAGIKRDDIIQTFSGHRVTSFDQLTSYTEETLPGDAVRLGVWRNGQVLTINVQF